MAAVKLKQRDFGRGFGLQRVFGTGPASSSALPGATTQLTSIGNRDRGLGNHDHWPVDCKQIVEPAEYRYASDVLAIGNDPDVRG